MANEEYRPVTAQDRIAPHLESEVDADAKKRAKDAGVVHAGYVDYEKALKNYEGRSDTESLEARRARDNGVRFDDQSFRRQAEDPEWVEPAEAREGRHAAEEFQRAQAAKTNEVSEGREEAVIADPDAQDKK